MNARLPRASTLVALLVPMALAGSGGGVGQDPVAPALRFTWTNPVLEGQSDAARAHIVRMRSYLQVNHPNLSMFPLTDYNPLSTRMTWVASFKSAAQMEITMSNLEQEEGWLALQEQQDGIIDRASGEFNFMLPVVLRDPPGPPMTFWWRRKARAEPTHLARAIRFARAEAEYINTKYPAARMEVYAAVERQVGWIYWYCEFGSSDLWRDIQTRLWADEDYLDLLEDAPAVFDPASWEELFDTVP